ncbi:proline racemase family protein [Marinobacter sp. SS21]|uniref:proline racemase family protein n=1 Tax=Marinobacter sp. SS21 TaxID=2979460 RepID=UPI00232BDDDF|nr:proline racemase family protein [Marinobacter sp. SS21]MDC0662750.1 proline racemase family protein [Marinobacter sp. SS21]
MRWTSQRVPQGRRMRSIQLVDMQAGGDVSRIVLDGVGPLPGGSVLEQMRYIQAYADGFRRWLLNEPYGDPFMSIDLIVPPADPRADAGYIIMEAMGYPLYSGSNTLCTATAVLEQGLVPMEDGVQQLVLESPGGLAYITARNRNGRVESVTTRSEPAFVAERHLKASVPGYGTVPFTLAWSGAYFALLDAPGLGFELNAHDTPELARFGLAFVEAARPVVTQDHPSLGRVGPLPFAHFMGPLDVTDTGFRSTSATYVHPGVICRSPTGTGMSARLALMYDCGQISDGETLEAVSPRGSSFLATVLGEAQVAGFKAVNSEITGRAWPLALSRIVLDLDDPLVDCSDLEPILLPS